MFCKNCGEKLRDDAKFCKKCGAVTKYNRQLQAEVSAKMQEAESPKQQEAESPKQQEAVAPKQLEIVAPKQQTNAPTKQQDVYIYEKRENWGESKDDEIFGGKIWPWIVFGIFLTFLLTACAVTLYFVLKGNCVLP